MATRMSSAHLDPFADSSCTLTLLVDAKANQAFRTLCEVSPQDRASQRARERRQDRVARTMQRFRQVQEG